MTSSNHVPHDDTATPDVTEGVRVSFECDSRLIGEGGRLSVVHLWTVKMRNFWEFSTLTLGNDRYRTFVEKSLDFRRC